MLDCIGLDGELWLSTEGEAFATVRVGDHFEHMSLRKTRFEEFMIDWWFTETGDAPGGQPVKEAVAVLSAKARKTGVVHETQIRVAELDGELWIDLCDPAWRAVRVAAQGWSSEPRAPVKFLRTGAMLPLPEPELGGMIEELRGFINVSEESDDDFILVVSWMIGAFHPRGPYPILVVDGEQGSAKSTLSKICRRLVDPNASPIRAAPATETDLMVAAANSWVIALDNQSGVSSWLSDALCRLATGAGLSMRELYTTKDEAWFSASRPAILNGMDGVGGRADLVDRCIGIVLPEIGKKAWRTERALWEEFEAARPRIFGALLDGLVWAVRDERNVKPVQTRMADFATWNVAASPGACWTPEQFIEAYENNRSGAARAAIEADHVADAVMKLVEGYTTKDKLEVPGVPLPYERAPTALHAELEQIVGSISGGAAVLKSRSWPAVNKLRPRLRRAQGPLRREKIVLELDGRKSGPKRERTIIIRRP